MNNAPISLHHLAEIAGASITGLQARDDLRITGIDLVSGRINGGDLFVALPGTRCHGAIFAKQTPAAAILTDPEGAELLREELEDRPVLVVPDVRAVLGEVSAELFGNPSREMTVIGITGTSGKTTTSYLVENGLMAAGAKVGLIGTTGTRIDGRPIPTELTTPEAPTLQALFRRMADEGVTHVVMEVSSHALSLRRVLGVDFDVAGFTNLSQDHLDFHPTMQDYFDAKALLFDPDSPMSAARAAVCIDEDWGVQMSRIARNAVTVATRGEDADVTASEPAVCRDGVQEFQVRVGGVDHPVRLPLPGRFNVANAALAVALGAACQVDVDRFARSLVDVAVPGRMERIDRGQQFVAVVDYAHKPQAIAEALRSLRDQVDGRLGIVVGAGGNRDHAKRPLMGENAAEQADLVIVTDDNPRDEDPAQIRQAVLGGARRAAERRGGVEVREQAGRARAIEELVAWAQPGDAIVVAGKGHETGQLIRGVKHHFDDREVLTDALSRRIGDHDAEPKEKRS